MDKNEVVTALQNLNAQRERWNDANREFRHGYDKVLRVLLLHAAQAYLSLADIAKASDLTRKQVRDKMRMVGLYQRDGKRLMADQAAKALAENTELLGVDVAQILTSPLAYLPMGDQMIRDLEMKTAPPVTELPSVYQEDSDEFNPEWLDYLGSLTTNVGVGHWRTSHNRNGVLVRVEFWLDDDSYVNYWVNQ